jgi:hypothetical protein
VRFRECTSPNQELLYHHQAFSENSDAPFKTRLKVQPVFFAVCNNYKAENGRMLSNFARK